MAKANMQPGKTSVPVQDAAVRAHNFEEVSQGYTPALAQNEASRCLDCRHKPCVAGCPVGIDIPAFIHEIREGDFEKAYRVIKLDSSLPAVCGRVCPQENQCEKVCVRGIKGEPVAIGRLERFAADWHALHGDASVPDVISNGHRVAIVGSGPSGLSCAWELAVNGCDVTIFEALHEPGGVLVYGIPEFRLPKRIVAEEVARLREIGVDVETNMIIGKTLTIDDLFASGYEAVYIGSGAGLPMFMDIPGESSKGVYSANEYLTRSNLMKAYRPDSETPIMKGGHTVVVGGGNVAMDAARTALRLGADRVTIVYRRSDAELPARREEIEFAREEGIQFLFLTNPVEILSYHNPENPRDPRNGFVRAVRCIRMELGEPDERGRRRPVPVEGSEFIFDADTVVMALGTRPNPLIKSTTEGLDTDKWGCIIADEETGLTSRPNVYAGGDTVTGAATVISAMGAGKSAARAILRRFSEA